MSDVLLRDLLQQLEVTLHRKRCLDDPQSADVHPIPRAPSAMLDRSLSLSKEELKPMLKQLQRFLVMMSKDYLPNMCSGLLRLAEDFVASSRLRTDVDRPSSSDVGASVDDKRDDSVDFWVIETIHLALSAQSTVDNDTGNDIAGTFVEKLASFCFARLDYRFNAAIRSEAAQVLGMLSLKNLHGVATLFIQKLEAIVTHAKGQYNFTDGKRYSDNAVREFVPFQHAVRLLGFGLKQNESDQANKNQAVATVRYLERLAATMPHIERGVLREEICTCLQEIFTVMSTTAEWAGFAAGAGGRVSSQFWTVFESLYKIIFTKWAKKAKHRLFCMEAARVMISLSRFNLYVEWKTDFQRNLLDLLKGDDEVRLKGLELLRDFLKEIKEEFEMAQRPEFMKSCRQFLAALFPKNRMFSERESILVQDCFFSIAKLHLDYSLTALLDLLELSIYTVDEKAVGLRTLARIWKDMVDCNLESKVSLSKVAAYVARWLKEATSPSSSPQRRIELIPVVKASVRCFPLLLPPNSKDQLELMVTVTFLTTSANRDIAMGACEALAAYVSSKPSSAVTILREMVSGLSRELSMELALRHFTALQLACTSLSETLKDLDPSFIEIEPEDWVKLRITVEAVVLLWLASPEVLMRDLAFRTLGMFSSSELRSIEERDIADNYFEAPPYLFDSLAAEDGSLAEAMDGPGSQLVALKAIFPSRYDVFSAVVVEALPLVHSMWSLNAKGCVSSGYSPESVESLKNLTLMMLWLTRRPFAAALNSVVYEKFFADVIDAVLSEMPDGRAMLRVFKHTHESCYDMWVTPLKRLYQSKHFSSDPKKLAVVGRVLGIMCTNVSIVQGDLLGLLKSVARELVASTGSLVDSVGVCGAASCIRAFLVVSKAESGALDSRESEACLLALMKLLEFTGRDAHDDQERDFTVDTIQVDIFLAMESLVAHGEVASSSVSSYLERIFVLVRRSPRVLEAGGNTFVEFLRAHPSLLPAFVKGCVGCSDFDQSMLYLKAISDGLGVDASDEVKRNQNISVILLFVALYNLSSDKLPAVELSRKVAKCLARRPIPINPIMEEDPLAPGLELPVTFLESAIAYSGNVASAYPAMAGQLLEVACCYAKDCNASMLCRFLKTFVPWSGQLNQMSTSLNEEKLAVFARNCLRCMTVLSDALLRATYGRGEFTESWSSVERLWFGVTGCSSPNHNSMFISHAVEFLLDFQLSIQRRDATGISSTWTRMLICSLARTSAGVCIADCLGLHLTQYDHLKFASVAELCEILDSIVGIELDPLEYGSIQAMADLLVERPELVRPHLVPAIVACLTRYSDAADHKAGPAFLSRCLTGLVINPCGGGEDARELINFRDEHYPDLILLNGKDALKEWTEPTLSTVSEMLDYLDEFAVPGLRLQVLESLISCAFQSSADNHGVRALKLVEALSTDTTVANLALYVGVVYSGARRNLECTGVSVVAAEYIQKHITAANASSIRGAAACAAIACLGTSGVDSFDVWGSIFRGIYEAAPVELLTEEVLLQWVRALLLDEAGHIDMALSKIVVRGFANLNTYENAQWIVEMLVAALPSTIPQTSSLLVSIFIFQVLHSQLGEDPDVGKRSFVFWMNCKLKGGSVADLFKNFVGGTYRSKSRELGTPMKASSLSVRAVGASGVKRRASTIAAAGVAAVTTVDDKLKRRLSVAQMAILGDSGPSNAKENGPNFFNDAVAAWLKDANAATCAQFVMGLIDWLSMSTVLRSSGMWSNAMFIQTAAVGMMYFKQPQPDLVKAGADVLREVVRCAPVEVQTSVLNILAPVSKPNMPNEDSFGESDEHVQAARKASANAIRRLLMSFDSNFITDSGTQN